MFCSWKPQKRPGEIAISPFFRRCQVKRHDGVAASAGLTSSLQKAEEPECLDAMGAAGADGSTNGWGRSDDYNRFNMGNN